jgi:DNA primase
LPVADFSQTVKQQADIVKIIGGYIRLRKAGAQNYSALCPFHKEKSPSFSVHAGRQFYHCFGCGQSGDVFSFVGKIENAGFPEAVRIVAQKCGIPLPKREFNSPEEAAEAGQRRKLLDLHETAAAWFEEQLRSSEGALAREYLAGRGVTAEAIKIFRLGYAPDNFNGLRDRLAPLADAETLRASGLFSSKDSEDQSGNVVQGRMYDRFRKRVTFPICNESGRVIAFTARALDSGDKAGPKYINSPETPLYSKGQVLFNFDKAKPAMRSMDFALFVEGQMDCITVYMGGIQNVIAFSGTALTEAQVLMVKRNTTNAVVFFDPDSAGDKAKEKSIDLLTELGFTIRIIVKRYADGLDPDRFVRERGIAAFAAVVRNAQKRFDFLVERAMEQFPGKSADAKIKAMNYLLPYIRQVPEKLERDQFAHDAAQKLGIDSAVLREELRQAALKRQDRIQTRATTVTEVERVLLRALAITGSENAQARRLAVEAIGAQPDRFEHLGTFPCLQELARRQADGQDKDPMDAVDDPAQRALLAEVLLQEVEPPAESEVHSAILHIEERALESERRAVIALITEAEGRGDFAEVVLLTQRKMELDRELRRLHNHDGR